MHGGTIEAKSDGEGQGATFTVRLPAAAAPPKEVLIDAKQVLGVHENYRHAESPDLAGVRILAIDDLPDTRELLRFVLEQYGADVITAGSAREAFEVLSRWKAHRGLRYRDAGRRRLQFHSKSQKS